MEDYFKYSFFQRKDKYYKTLLFKTLLFKILLFKTLLFKTLIIILFMQESIYLYSRGDRLGSHIIQYLSIIIYAYYNNLYIVYEQEKVNYNNPDYEYEGTKYNESFIVKAILNWIDNHNKKFPSKDYLAAYKGLRAMEYCLNFETSFKENEYFYSCDLLIITTQVLYNIRTDLISYFKKYICKGMRQEIYKVVPQNYILPYDPKKSILVHLRLGDVKDRPDYDGSICSNHYKNRINNDIQSIQGIATLGYCNMQTPLAKNKVDLAILEATQKYPEHEVVIVTAPGDYSIDYPYRCIRSDNESYDMFFLCNADVLILSRSTFSLSAAFLGTAREIWSPLWGHFVCTGLYTKYDNSKFNYFF